MQRQVVKDEMAEGHSAEGVHIADGAGRDVEVFDGELGDGCEIRDAGLFESKVAEGEIRERGEVGGIGVVEMEPGDGLVGEGLETSDGEVRKIDGKCAVGLGGDAVVGPIGLGAEFFQAGAKGGFAESGIGVDFFRDGGGFNEAVLGAEREKQIALALVFIGLGEELAGEGELRGSLGVVGLEGEDFFEGGYGVVEVAGGLEEKCALELGWKIGGVEIGGRVGFLKGFIESCLGEEGARKGEKFGSGSHQSGEGLLGALAFADGGVFFAQQLDGKSGGKRENEDQSG